ncbi:MAG TPA: hypothetical protein VJT73_15665, partial [Polyangiaceae bacterium]|nr:hypothetical protein [Polyangiaceae bacterium]
VLTFFGFMHGEAISFGESPVVAFSYLAVAAILVGCAKYATTSTARESIVPPVALPEHAPEG